MISSCSSRPITEAAYCCCKSLINVVNKTRHQASSSFVKQQTTCDTPCSWYMWPTEYSRSCAKSGALTIDDVIFLALIWDASAVGRCCRIAIDLGRVRLVGVAGWERQQPRISLVSSINLTPECGKPASPHCCSPNHSVIPRRSGWAPPRQTRRRPKIISACLKQCDKVKL